MDKGGAGKSVSWGELYLVFVIQLSFIIYRLTCTVVT